MAPSLSNNPRSPKSLIFQLHSFSGRRKRTRIELGRRRWWSLLEVRSLEAVRNWDPMKHILKLMALICAVSACWIGLLETSIVPRTYTWLLPVYLVVSLGCYGLLMVGIGLMLFPTCPQEAFLLQKDIAEAKEFLNERGVDVGSD